MSNDPKSHPLLEAALGYARRGWYVLPCKRDKAPLVGHGVKDATTDEQTIEVWWGKWPDANIGLATGEASGFFVVDIDGPEGDASLRELEAEHGELPRTLESVTGSGVGRHLLYTYPKNRRIGNRQGVRSKIDIRGEGGYVVAPPSIHASGRKYVWECDPLDPTEDPADVAILEAPEWLVDLIAPVYPPDKAAGGAPERSGPVTPPPSSALTDDKIVEQARKYLAAIPPAIQGQAGHSQLLWAAQCMVRGFMLDDDTALALLWSEYNPRCVPPWDPNEDKDRRDFERKVSEARKAPVSKPDGWLLANARDGAISDEEFERQCAEFWPEGEGNPPAGFYLDALRNPEPEPEFESEAEEKAESESEMKPPSEYLLKPPGLAGEICEWINRTAKADQPFLALGATLTVLGAVFGQKVRDRSNGRTNIYGMGIAPSSAGKDHAPECLMALIEAAGGGRLLGGSDVTSDAAIEAALCLHPVQMFFFDEIGHMMAKVKAVSGSNPHLKSIVPYLMKIYSSPHKVFRGKQYAPGSKGELRPVRRIDQPHVCLWGYTSPDALYEGMSESELRDGWLGRIMTFISLNQPEIIMRDFVPPPPHLVTKVKEWVDRTVPPPVPLEYKPLPETVAGIDKASTAHQTLYRDTEEAQKILEAFSKECRTRMFAAQKADDPCGFLWGKALQNARRVALVIAVGDQEYAIEGGTIEAKHAQFGVDLAQYCVERFALAIEKHAFVSRHEQECRKIVALLKAAPKGQMVHSALLKKTRLSAFDFKGRIETLTERHDITRCETPTQGKVATWYSLRR